jgi:hypothetical protein
LTRKRKRPGWRSRRPVRASVTAGDDPGWVSIGGRLMFVVGYTPGGAPYGVFEDEMDDLDVGDRTASEAPSIAPIRVCPVGSSDDRQWDGVGVVQVEARRARRQHWPG